MTREEAVDTLFKLIDSRVLAPDIERQLDAIANTICHDTFEDCEVGDEYCEGCPHLKRG